MRPRLLLAVTDAQSVQLLRGQLAVARRAGADVYVMSSLGEAAARIAREEGASFLPIELSRQVAPWRDVRAFGEIVEVVRELAPDLVDASTPKAGFLVMLAAWLNHVPVRVHTLRGLRHQTTDGWLRRALLAVEWATCRMAHRVICISPSLRDEAVSLRLVAGKAAIALGAGSANGVDVTQFQRSPARVAAGARFREANQIGADAFVVGFVGRVARDKGLRTLADAWRRRAGRRPDDRLLVVGLPDATDPIDEATRRALEGDPTVSMIGRLDDVAVAYAAMDLLVLPSFREGFGNVLIEAGAMELPVIASRISGCLDAVDDGVTGTLIAPGDPGALAATIDRYAGDRELRQRHGRAGRDRVERLFRQEDVCRRLMTLYQQLLEEHGRSTLAGGA